MTYIIAFLIIIFMFIFWSCIFREAFTEFTKHMESFKKRKEPKYKSVIYDRLFEEDGSWVLKEPSKQVPYSKSETQNILNTYNYDIISDNALDSVVVYYPVKDDSLWNLSALIPILIFIIVVLFIVIPCAIYGLFNNINP